LHPAVNEDGLKASTARYVDIISRSGGEITRVETWGKRRLSYEIMKQPEGHYYFYKFRGASALVNELGRQLRIDENVLRHMIVRDERPPATRRNRARSSRPEDARSARTTTVRRSSGERRMIAVARETKTKGKRGDKKEKREKRPLRKKKCKFCLDRVTFLDYKEERRLRRFMTDRGKIAPRRITGTCAKHQRMLAMAVKRASDRARRTCASITASRRGITWKSYCSTVYKLGNRGQTVKVSRIRAQFLSAPAAPATGPTAAFQNERSGQADMRLRPRRVPGRRRRRHGPCSRRGRQALRFGDQPRHRAQAHEQGDEIAGRSVEEPIKQLGVYRRPAPASRRRYPGPVSEEKE
jgi:small subunit ribosomal protein S18